MKEVFIIDNSKLWLDPFCEMYKTEGYKLRKIANLLDLFGLTRDIEEEEMPPCIILGDGVDKMACDGVDYKNYIKKLGSRCPEEIKMLEELEDSEPYFPSRMKIIIDKICKEEKKEAPKICVMTTDHYYNKPTVYYEMLIEYGRKNDIRHFFKKSGISNVPHEINLFEYVYKCVKESRDYYR